MIPMENKARKNLYDNDTIEGWKKQDESFDPKPRRSAHHPRVALHPQAIAWTPLALAWYAV
jgi:hypothetical protein